MNEKKLKIGLIDVDGKNFPNLPLMKISAWHKMNDDLVEFYDTFAGIYDLVYMSKVFSFTSDYQYYINAHKVIKGGTGYALSGAGGKDYDYTKDPILREEIEHIMPDYNLYGIKNTAYGFLTRGCPRGCTFCIVAKKEGCNTYRVADLEEFWSGQKNIVLLDANILAYYNCERLLQQLIASRAWVDFNQGLDARLLTPQKCDLLSQIKIKEIHFAWDNYEDMDIILPKLEMFAKYSRKPHSHNAIVYVLVNYNSTINQDLERVYTLRKMGYWAYIMIYDKAHCNPIYKHMQRWVNNRFIFAKCDNFDKYLKTK